MEGESAVMPDRLAGLMPVLRSEGLWWTGPTGRTAFGAREEVPFKFIASETAWVPCISQTAPLRSLYHPTIMAGP